MDTRPSAAAKAAVKAATAFMSEGQAPYQVRGFGTAQMHVEVLAMSPEQIAGTTRSSPAPATAPHMEEFKEMTKFEAKEKLKEEGKERHPDGPPTRLLAWRASLLMGNAAATQAANSAAAANAAFAAAAGLGATAGKHAQETDLAREYGAQPSRRLLGRLRAAGAAVVAKNRLKVFLSL